MIRLQPGVDLAAMLTAALDMSRMTQAELARATGFADGQISKWRRGVVIPSAPVLIRLANGLGYDLALIPREDAP